MEILAVAGGAAHPLVAAAAAAAENTGLEINFFWVIVAAANFLLFFAVLWTYGFKPITGMLEQRRTRIAEGLRDAETARRDREKAEAERATVIQEARREAGDIVGRAQKAAQDLREADLTATREELDRLRERAAAEIEAEKQRAIADLRAEVADLALAAAGKVVGESMTSERHRRIVEEFLAEPIAEASAPAGETAKARGGPSTEGASSTDGAPSAEPGPGA